MPDVRLTGGSYESIVDWPMIHPVLEFSIFLGAVWPEQFSEGVDCVLEIFLSTEKLLVLLRDGRKLLGILRSFDQFGTAVNSP
ncbi:hypothetical protein SASPL_123282 [Salvia splendens]|uniref:U6 snRNA-associated Sm-like protein LSm1 n=1 Tax=Salvia splendens TaxID=180675 RepID=A0A8X8XPX9_SALSN|nr:hypothetical protein SASPL_123282 [Salvia splendens]